MTSILPRVKTGVRAAALSLSNIARVLSILAVTILLGRTLGPDVLGQFSLLLAAVAILQSVSIGGLSGAAIHKLIIGTSEHRRSTEVIVAARIILIPLFYSVGVLLFLAFFYSQEASPLPVIALFIGYAIGTFDVPEILWMSRSGFSTIAFRRSALVVCMAVPKLAAAASGKYELVLVLQGVEAALWQGVLVLGSGMGWSVLRRGSGSLSAGLSQLNELRSLWFSSIAAVVAARADIFIVSAFLGAAAVGQYATASRFVEAATILAAALTGVLFNDMVKATADAGEYARHCTRAARMTFALGMLVMIGLMVAGPIFIVTLYGEEFRLSAEILIVYSVTTVLIFQRQLISRVLIIERAYAHSLASNILGLTINVVLNIALIPILGIWGAVFAAIAGYALSVICTFLPTRFGRDLLMVSVCSIGRPGVRLDQAVERLEQKRKGSVQ